MKNRNVSVDLFRFLAALSIMFLHTCWGLDDSLLNAYPIIGIVIGRYPVILFFTISGILLFFADFKGTQAAKIIDTQSFESLLCLDGGLLSDEFCLECSSRT